MTDAAEGNPLFVEEMLEMLISYGRRSARTALVSVGKMEEVAVPPSISSLLDARLDRLLPNTAVMTGFGRWKGLLRRGGPGPLRECRATPTCASF